MISSGKTGADFWMYLVNVLQFRLVQILHTPCYLVLSLIFLIAIIGPWFVGDPLALSAGPRLTSPSFNSPFGTDQYGMEGLKFWTKAKKVTQRWPDGGGDGSNAFVIPTMG